MENIDDIDYRHGKNVFKVKHYYLQMYLKTLEICALKCMSLILLVSYHYQD